MLKYEYSSYSPIKYKKFLYFENDAHFNFPIGISDPLRIINSFIETLEKVWNYKLKLSDHYFNEIRFQGLGLLQAKNIHTGKFETLIAYCGGFVKETGKCGNTPLIIGREKTCNFCGKLICPKCNYCSNNCQRIPHYNAR